MNKVQLIGWLGNDAVVKASKEGRLYARLRLCTDQQLETAPSPGRKTTTWHTVWIWDPAIVASHQHDLVSGSHVMVEGSLHYRVYTDANGRYNHIAEIKADSLIDLDR